MAAFTRVLVVEDEPVFRSIVARNLRARGCQVEEADTTAAAIASLNRQLPDLILLDISLPDRSGWDLLRQLRSEGKDVPTIIVSAVRVSQDRLDEFKPLAYLPKPFPLDALIRVVETGRLAEVEVEP